MIVCVSCSVMSDSLCHPMDCSPPGFSVYRILQAIKLEWVTIPFFFRGSSWPRDQIQVSCIAGRFLTVWDTREALQVWFSSVQSLSCVQLFVNPWIAAHQASLSITNSRSSLRLMSIESLMPSSHLILCCPFLLLPPIPPSIRVFSNESTLHMRWPKYWSFSFSIIPSKEIPDLLQNGLVGSPCSPRDSHESLYTPSPRGTEKVSEKLTPF